MTAQNPPADPPRTTPERTILMIVAAYAAAFVLFGLTLQSPAALLGGLADIVTTRDALLTDYFGVGGIGGGCVNAGLLTLAAALVYHWTGARITGASVAALFLVLGIWPLRQEPRQRVGDRSWRLSLCQIQAGAVRLACQYRFFRRRARAGLFRDPVQHVDPVCARRRRWRWRPAS